MKVIGTLAMIQHAGNGKFIIISPRDDLWFVHEEDSTEAMRKEADELCKGTPNAVVGYILQGEKSK